MLKLIPKKFSRKSGMPPGSLVYVGEKKTEKPEINIFDYDDADIKEKKIEDLEEISQFVDSRAVSWINVDGLHEVELIEKIGDKFNIHPLVLEDVLNTGQRPKVEDYDKYHFIVMKMITYSEDKGNGLDIEQVSFVLGDNYLISFQERPGDVFDPVRQRLRNHKGKVRKMGADYLCYTLLDAIVDNYFGVIEKFGDRIEALEESLLVDSTKKELVRIQNLKKGISFLRKSVLPVREVAGRLEQSESELISKVTKIYFRDVYDHTIQVMESIESFREMSAGMLEIYLSNLSNKMNAVMKTLTVIATMFIPLTFVVGIYGMNFKYMPELEYKWGYAAVWVVMISIIIGMIIYFNKKDWL